MDVRRLDDPVAFLDAAGPLLVEDEARHNLILGIAGTLRDHPSVYPEHFLWLAEENGVQGAAVRTPPYNLALARPRKPEALGALAVGIDDDLPGVVGAQPEVESFARAWAERTGATLRTVRGQGVFRLDRVEPVSHVPGQMREATAEDRPLLIAWWDAFMEEAIGEAAVGLGSEAAVDHRLRADSAGIVLWNDGDEAVSLAAFGNPTPHGVRIGPVYTPPNRRRNGYASALTAALSESLRRTYRFCFLFTDLANPTANRIYEQIGYRRVCEAAEIAFD
jgi:ribosomal protein S18 acetylase RimI-like enzyme